MKKRVLSIVLSMMMVVSMVVGCGSKDSVAEADNSVEQKAETEATDVATADSTGTADNGQGFPVDPVMVAADYSALHDDAKTFRSIVVNMYDEDMNIITYHFEKAQVEAATRSYKLNGVTEEMVMLGDKYDEVLSYMESNLAELPDMNRDNLQGGHVMIEISFVTMDSTAGASEEPNFYIVLREQNVPASVQGLVDLIEGYTAE